MSSIPILDLVVGMIFIFFILSIISSSVVEIVLSFYKIRARYLAKWLRTIFDKKIIQPDGTTLKLGQAIMDHCLVTALSKAGNATTYIDAKNFVSALLEKISYNHDNPEHLISNLDEVIHSIRFAKALDGTTMLSTELKRTLLIMANEVKLSYQILAKKEVSDLDLFRKKLEGWYDSNMDRVTGTMKRKYIRPLTFWIGVIVVVGLNADALRIAKYLYSNPDVRKRVAAVAYNSQADTALQQRLYRLKELQAINVSSDTVRQKEEEIIKNLEAVSMDVKQEVAILNELIPLGWGKAQSTYFRDHIASSLGGWLASVMAIMLGAPFWFDLLNKIANLRSSGPKPASQSDKDRKDASTDK